MDFIKQIHKYAQRGLFIEILCKKYKSTDNIEFKKHDIPALWESVIYWEKDGEWVKDKIGANTLDVIMPKTYEFCDWLLEQRELNTQIIKTNSGPGPRKVENTFLKSNSNQNILKGQGGPGK